MKGSKVISKKLENLKIVQKNRICANIFVYYRTFFHRDSRSSSLNTINPSLLCLRVCLLYFIFLFNINPDQELCSICLRVGWYRRQPDKNMIPADQLKFFWCNVQGVLLTKEGWTAVLFVCLARRVVLLKISGFARACICSYGLFILLRQCSCLCTAIILKELGHDEKGVRCTR